MVNLEDHNHKPDPERLEKLQGEINMKKYAAESNDPPRTIIKKVTLE